VDRELVSSTVVRTTTMPRRVWGCPAFLSARSGPMTSQRSGIFAGVFEGERMVDGGMDVLVDDTVLSRRVVDLHRA
jgi:hypothetical protein